LFEDLCKLGLVNESSVLCVELLFIQGKLFLLSQQRFALTQTPFIGWPRTGFEVAHQIPLSPYRHLLYFAK